MDAGDGSKKTSGKAVRPRLEAYKAFKKKFDQVGSEPGKFMDAHFPKKVEDDNEARLRAAMTESLGNAKRETDHTFKPGHINEARQYGAYLKKYQGMPVEQRNERRYYPQAEVKVGGGGPRRPDLMKQIDKDGSQTTSFVEFKTSTFEEEQRLDTMRIVGTKGATVKALPNGRLEEIKTVKSFKTLFAGVDKDRRDITPPLDPLPAEKLVQTQAGTFYQSSDRTFKIINKHANHGRPGPMDAFFGGVKKPPLAGSGFTSAGGSWNPSDEPASSSSSVFSSTTTTTTTTTAYGGGNSSETKGKHGVTETHVVKRPVKRERPTDPKDALANKRQKPLDAFTKKSVSTSTTAAQDRGNSSEIKGEHGVTETHVVKRPEKRERPTDPKDASTNKRQKLIETFAVKPASTSIVRSPNATPSTQSTDNGTSRTTTAQIQSGRGGSTFPSLSVPKPTTFNSGGSSEQHKAPTGFAKTFVGVQSPMNRNAGSTQAKTGVQKPPATPAGGPRKKSAKPPPQKSTLDKFLIKK
jgi:hypothetical protein